MNINIALNTIIIIMVFLFPGVLFRKFYFTGKFGNQFEQGNLLERFLWSLFLSFVCLSSVAIIFHFLNTLCDLHPLESIDFKKISDIFKSLSKNEFPTSFSDKEEFVNFLMLILIIYLISASLGYLVHNVIRLFSFDTFAVFKFKNNWHYLSQPYKENGVSRKIGDVFTTFVDVLTKNNSKDELYSGILNNFILDKEDKLENIVLSNVNKFVSVEKSEVGKIQSIEKSISDNENIFTLHRDYYDKKVFRKSVAGNLLVLANENIININFTYVKTSNKIKEWKRSFFISLSVLYSLGLLMLIILPFLQIERKFLSTLSNKIVFSATTLLVMSLLLNTMSSVLKIKLQDNRISIKDFIFTLLLFSTPYLWIFDVLSIGWTIGAFFIVLFLFAIFQSPKKD